MKQVISWTLNRFLLLPPALKGNLSARIGKLLLKKVPTAPKVTNLGISTNLRVSFDGEVPPHYLFGKPEMDGPEFGALEVCRVLSKTCDAFLDFGAHRGYFSFYVQSGNPGRPIYYFEPIPFLFDEIENNMARNHLRNVTGVRAAVGAKVGTTTFYISKKSLVSSSLKLDGMPEGGHEAIDTDILTFDEIARRYQFKSACVKVDVENAEFEFLAGAAQEKSRIGFFIVEILAQGHEKNSHCL